MYRSPERDPHTNGTAPQSAEPPDSRELAPRVAVAITAVVIACFFAVAVTYVFRTPTSPLRIVGCLATLTGLFAVQLTHSFPLLVRSLAPHRRWTLLLQGLLTFLPFAVFGEAWLGMPGFLGASALLVLDTYAAWAVFAGTVASVGVLQFTVGYGVEELPYNLVATVLTGLVVYGISRLADLVREVQTAREDLTQLAVTEERLRFARDLHDLLGYSLSTITMKCELTHRLMAHQPERAREELAEVMQAAHQALSDVRSVAQGYRSMSVHGEAAAAEAMLSSIGIATHARLAIGSVPDAVDTVLATVLRESVTNILRHSKAQSCRIEAVRRAGHVRLRIENDGRVDTGPTANDAAGPSASGPSPAPDPGASGTGIRNLTTRVARLGGRLSAGPAGHDGFKLSVVVPVEAGNR